MLTWDQIKSNIPEELRSDKSLEDVTSLEGLTKSFIHAQKSMGAEKYVIPDKHATEADWKQVFQKLGNPESIEDYKINAEGDQVLGEETVNKIKAAAHEAGVLPHQFEKVLASINTEGKALNDTQELSSKTAYDEQMGKLKTEWGEQYDNQVKKANAAFKHLVPEKADRDAFLKTGMGDHPMVAKLLANASKYMTEDQFVGTGDGALGGLTPKDALARAVEIQGNMNHPYRNKEHIGHIAAKKEVADLYATAYPEE